MEPAGLFEGLLRLLKGGWRNFPSATPGPGPDGFTSEVEKRTPVAKNSLQLPALKITWLDPWPQ